MRRVLFSCFCGLLWSSSGWAVDPLGTININLHGNVVDFSCTVNTADIDNRQMAYDTTTERWRYHGTRPF